VVSPQTSNLVERCGGNRQRGEDRAVRFRHLDDGEKSMVKSRPLAVLLSLVAGLLLAVGLVAPASATTTAGPGAASSARQACAIQATAFETRGNVNVVTATRTECRPAALAAPDSVAANVHVGYGCKDSNFENTCWWFDVASPGCSGGRVWTWSTIVQNNVLSSWEAVGTCSHGILYDLPGPGGASITCYTCYGLGSMNDKTSALRVYP
jgi:hypothetical protein